jgi:hypothetical protein
METALNKSERWWNAAETDPGSARPEAAEELLHGCTEPLILRGDPPVLKDDDEQQHESANAAPAPALTAVLIMRRRMTPEFSSILPVRSL